MRTRLMKALMPLSAAMLPLPALAQTTADRPDYWHYGWDWGHMLYGSLMMVLLWGGIILVIVLAVRWLGGGTSGPSGKPPFRKAALEILEERFARGEIDKEEFEERKRLLSD